MREGQNADRLLGGLTTEAENLQILHEESWTWNQPVKNNGNQ